MSKEKEPIRSRRQLREQSGNATGAAEQPSVSVRPAPSTPPNSAPAPRGDSGSDSPAPRERQSQTRARDRAALRAYKELIDPPGMSPLPSRRTLRQAQLDAERAPITAVNPVVQVPSKPAKPAAAAVRPTPVEPNSVPMVTAQAFATAPESAPGDEGKAHDEPEVAAAPSQSPKNAQPAAKPAREPAAAAKAANAPGANTRGGRRAAAMNPALKNRQAAQQDVADPGTTQAVDAPVEDAPAVHAEAHLDDAVDAAEATTVLPDDAPVANSSSPLPELTPGDDYYPVSAGPPQITTPSTEELAVLAAQKAEDERTAILALRAQARERLAQESAKSRRPAADPTSTNNLAMVTPLEFIEVPGVSRPVMRPPTTTHVPIVTRSTPRQAPAGRNRTGQPRPAQAPAAVNAASAHAAESAAGGSDVANTPAAVTPNTQTSGKGSAIVPNVSAERFDAALAASAVHRPGPGNRPLTGGRSSTLKRAEAMATGGHPAVDPGVEQVEVTRSQMPPMPADYAHGLEPLDARTAGLGRTQRNKLIQWGSLFIGGAGLVVSAIVFFTTLSR
ncbi:hypothetical protein ACX80E_05935 [Arthrobacter sp. TMN-49]